MCWHLCFNKKICLNICCIINYLQVDLSLVGKKGEKANFLKVLLRKNYTCHMCAENPGSPLASMFLLAARDGPMVVRPVWILLTGVFVYRLQETYARLKFSLPLEVWAGHVRDWHNSANWIIGSAESVWLAGIFAVLTGPSYHITWPLSTTS